METKKAKSARKLVFEKKEYDLLIGSLLGDGYLDKTTCGYALRIHHGITQKAYVDFKYQLIAKFTNSKPKRSGSAYYFRTVTHPIFDRLHKIFYQNGKKILPKEFIEKNLTPFALAIWIMDDGSKETRQLRINTQSFTRGENLCLSSLLQAKFGIETTINVDRGKYRLRIRGNGMPKLISLVKPYFIPDMLYKLPP